MAGDDRRARASQSALYAAGAATAAGQGAAAASVHEWVHPARKRY